MLEHTKNILKGFDDKAKSIDISGLDIEGELFLLRFNNLKELRCQNNKITKITYISDSVKYLDCSNNQIEYISELPPKLEYFNYENNPLTSIVYSDKFNKSIDDLEHTSFTKLYFGTNFNYTVNCLPKTLTHLKFGDDFNQSIESIPDGITNLTLGYKFNQSIEKLPKSIKKLTINAGYFSRSVDNLPNTITYLTLGHYFNSQIDNLPNSITHLKLGKRFNHPIDNLPNGITHLEFLSGNDKYDCPSSFTQPLNNLPNSITNLILPDSYNLELNSLPNSIIHLEIGGYYEQSIDNLPDSIETIDIQPIMLRDEEDGKIYGNDVGNIHKVNVKKLPDNIKYIRVCGGLSIDFDHESEYSMVEKFNAQNKICANNKLLENIENELEYNKYKHILEGDLLQLKDDKKNMILENRTLIKKYNFESYRTYTYFDPNEESDRKLFERINKRKLEQNKN